MHLMPAYFVMAEAKISDLNQDDRTERLKDAEDYLFAAYCNFIKYKEDMPAE